MTNIHLNVDPSTLRFKSSFDIDDILDGLYEDSELEDPSYNGILMDRVDQVKYMDLSDSDLLIFDNSKSD